MRIIRFAASVAIVAVLALVWGSPASARSCDHGDAACVPPSTPAAQSAPMKLDNFMQTWKPVAAAKASKKSRKASRQAVRQAAPKPAVVTPVAEMPAAEPRSEAAASREPTVETNGVGIASFDEVNAIDAAADEVMVVAASELNEIDLMSPVPPAPAETTGQAVSPDEPPADSSWIGKLLLAVAGTIGLAGAARFLIA